MAPHKTTQRGASSGAATWPATTTGGGTAAPPERVFASARHALVLHKSQQRVAKTLQKLRRLAESLRLQSAIDRSAVRAQLYAADTQLARVAIEYAGERRALLGKCAHADLARLFPAEDGDSDDEGDNTGGEMYLAAADEIETVLATMDEAIAIAERRLADLSARAEHPRDRRVCDDALEDLTSEVSGLHVRLRVVARVNDLSALYAVLLDKQIELWTQRSQLEKLRGVAKKLARAERRKASATRKRVPLLEDKTRQRRDTVGAMEAVDDDDNDDNESVAMLEDGGPLLSEDEDDEDGDGDGDVVYEEASI